MLDDTQVLALVRDGNSSAFSEITDHYQTLILRYLYRLTGDYDTAQDLTQDTFLQAYKNILKTNNEISLKAWLYKIATNNARQNGRRKKLLSIVMFKTGKTATDHRDDIQLNTLDENLAIQEVLNKIPGKFRVCMVLHFVEGFKYKEIAGALGISEEAVRKRVARGSDEFRRLYGGGGDK